MDGPHLPALPRPPCRPAAAVLPPIAPPSPIAAAAVHLDLYAVHRDRAARRDTKTTTMATGDDDNDVDGDGATGNEVDDDGDGATGDDNDDDDDDGDARWAGVERRRHARAGD